MSDSEIKAAVRAQLFRDFGAERLRRAGRAELAREIEGALKRARTKLRGDELPQMVQALLDDLTGYGPLTPLLADGTISEIMVNGPRAVFVEQGGVQVEVDTRFDDEQHLRLTVQRMAANAGRRVDESQPFVDMTLEDGTRVNAVLPPIAINGTLLTLRKPAQHLEGLDALVQLGSMDVAMARCLHALVGARANILFSGATATGKTTLLEVLSAYIEHSERIITIEDTPELRLRQRHVVRMQTRAANVEGSGEITLRDLFTNSLRMSPDRIILGEIRGREAFAFLQAVTSGHRGCLAVVHAASPEEAAVRLESLVALSGLNLPATAIRNQIAHGIDIVVQLERMADGSRKVTRISEIAGITPGGMVQVIDLFRFRNDGLDEYRRVRGAFEATGHRPRVLG